MQISREKSVGLFFKKKAYGARVALLCAYLIHIQIIGLMGDDL